MESINRPELVKEHNLNLVRETLFRARQATRQQLSALTGISTVTLGSLLQQLVETGEAQERESAPPGSLRPGGLRPDGLRPDGLRPASGRPARVYAYNPRWRLGLLVFVVFEKGDSFFRNVVVDLYGETLWEERSPADFLDREATLAYFRRLLDRYGSIGSVGLGLPGVGFGEYLHRKWEPGRFSLEALQELERSTGIPFRLENDVNLAALGYARSHGVGPEETLVYLYLMKGSYGGSAVYLNGGLHLGKDRCAGEFVSVLGGTDWSQAEPGPELQEQLLATVLPYLTILAPHRLVIASDYLTGEHLRALEEKAAALLEGYCPQFLLTDHFPQHYQEGLKQFVLEGFL